MKAIVVYESFWGNTAAIARAIAEGIGPDAQALSTSNAAEALRDGVDLIVAGAPLIAFSLPTDAMRDSLRNEMGAPSPADLSQPSMRSWLDSVPRGTGRSAAFETGLRWSPGSSAKTIAKDLSAKGYGQSADPQRFVVTGRYGPLKAGEVERARVWGARLASGAE